jgi:hypothetical protein
VSDPPDARRQERLVKELVTIRRNRIWVRSARLPELRDLALAVTAGDTRSDDARLRELLRLAAARLDKPNEQAVLLLLGLDPEASGKSTKRRQELAGDRLSASGSTFARRLQNELLRDLVKGLLVLEAERSDRSALSAGAQPFPATSDEGAAVEGSAPPTEVPATDSSDEEDLDGTSRRPTNGTDRPPDAPARSGDLEGVTVPSGGTVAAPAAGRGQRLRRWGRPLLAVGAAVIAAVVSLVSTSTWPFSSSTAAVSGAPAICSGPGGFPSGARPLAAHSPVLLNIDAQNPGSNSWSYAAASVPAGTTLKFLLIYKNISNKTQNQVVLHADWYPDTSFDASSACLYDSRYPRGKVVSPGYLSTGGFAIGDFKPGTGAYLMFSLTTPSGQDVDCGNTSFSMQGYVAVAGLEQYRSGVDVIVEKSCPPATVS